ncbi:MAG: LPXTG cell wall anchor domain-containing protein [Terriglobales bacterium]
MKPLLWIGVIVFVLGIASFFVPFPQRESQTLRAGGMSMGIETTHSQTLPATASVIMMVGGLMMAAAGGLFRKNKA